MQFGQPAKVIHVGRAQLNDGDRRKILENFVENDEALGQLLDFISSHYIQAKPGGPGYISETHSLETLTSKQSMDAKLKQR